MSLHDPEKDAEDLYEAFKDNGFKKEPVFEILVNRTNEERQLIREKYKEKYNGEDLQKLLASKMKGNLEDVAIALFDRPAEYDAKELLKAMKGAGTNEKSLIEIITSRTQKELEEIKKEFPKLEGANNKSLEEWIKDEISKDFLDITLALLKGERSENDNPNREYCEELGKKLAQLPKLVWNNDENSDIYKFFIKSSPKELSMICRYFHKYKGKLITDVIDSDFSGDVKKCLNALLFAVISPSEFCAEYIFKAMDGIGTNDKVLIRMLVTRAWKDLPLIKKYYLQKYKKDMITDIKGDCSGDYCNLLVMLASKDENSK